MDLLKMILIFGLIAVVAGKRPHVSVVLRRMLEQYLQKLNQVSILSSRSKVTNIFENRTPKTITIKTEAVSLATTTKATTTKATTTTIKSQPRKSYKSVVVLCDNFCVYNKYTKRFNKKCGDFKRKGVRCLFCRYDFKCGGGGNYFV